MAKRRSAEQIAELQAQAAAARRAAETATDIFTQDLSYAAAATLESVARSQLRQMVAEEEPVMVLPDNASVTEVRQVGSVGQFGAATMFTCPPGGKRRWVSRTPCYAPPCSVLPK